MILIQLPHVFCEFCFINVFLIFELLIMVIKSCFQFTLWCSLIYLEEFQCYNCGIPCNILCLPTAFYGSTLFAFKVTRFLLVGVGILFKIFELCCLIRFFILVVQLTFDDIAVKDFSEIVVLQEMLSDNL